MSIEELKAQMSKQAKRDALKCLRSTSQQLGKAAYQINELIDELVASGFEKTKEVKMANLEDVFIHKTGKALRED